RLCSTNRYNVTKIPIPSGSSSSFRNVDIFVSDCRQCDTADDVLLKMVQIWQMEPYPCGDPRLPHHVFPPKMITPDELSKRTGTLYWKLDTLDQVALSKRLMVMKLERSFTKEDIFTLDAETTANFRDKIDELFEESNYPEDQARMIIDGSAYYDVEDKLSDWGMEKLSGV
ncbi:ARD/ARD' family protein, partial [Teladorsagia circumcincta]